MDNLQALWNCAPTVKHENVVHHATRVIHNLFHPHHHVDYMPPLMLQCHEPEMDTVTITADHDVPAFTPPGTDDTGGAYYMPPGDYAPPGGGGYAYGSSIGSPGYGHGAAPVSVPEPSAWMFMLPMVWIIFMVTRKRV